MNAHCTVFISHAGEDKFTIAIPLYDALSHLSISSFVDKCSLRVGDDAPAQMVRHMETAPIGVFILSPHFLAKKWPMKELTCFLRRVDTAKRQMVKPPILIPVFYRMTVAQCTSKDIFKATDTHGESIFEKSGFNRRSDSDQTLPNQVLQAVERLSKNTGIENDEAATNIETHAMRDKRSKLVQRIATQVQDAASRHFAAQPSFSTPSYSPQQPALPPDSFSPKYAVPPLSPDCILDFTTRDHRGQCATPEGRLKERLMSVTALSGDRSAAAMGRVSPHVPGAIGMGGVGKSTAVVGIAWEPDIRDRFSDGIYFISAGANADQGHILLQISKVVEKSGGFHLASKIRDAPNLEHAVVRASPWFDGKKVLFLLDDLWETKHSSLGFFNELRGLASPEGRLVVTTRSKTIAQAAGHIVTFNAFGPLSEEAHCMLFSYVGLDVKTLSPSEMHASIHVRQILHRCAGLPLALGIVGRAIREIMDEDGLPLDDAMQKCCAGLEKGEEIDMLEETGAYRGLANTVQISLEAADRWFREKTQLSSSRRLLPPSELYERFAILRKQSRSSLAVLSKLWGTNNNTQTKIVANKLSKLSLLSLEKGRYMIHDLLMDECISRAKGSGRLQSYHDSFLEAFSCPLVDGLKRAWWDIAADCDGYLEENLARHLVGSGRHGELRDLLIDARWILYRVASGKYLSMENDFSEFYSGTNQLQRQVGDSPERRFHRSDCGMEFVERLVSLTWPHLRKSPAEIAFQVIGRLENHVRNVAEVRDFAKSAVENTRRPWLKPEHQCLSGAESASLNMIPIEGEVYAVVLNESGQRAFVGAESSNFAVDLLSRRVVEISSRVRSPVWSLAISGDGRRVVSGVVNNCAQVWEMTGGHLQEVNDLVEGNGMVRSVGISYDGKIIAVGSETGAMQVWDAENRRKIGQPQKGESHYLMCVALSDDGKWIVSGSSGGLLRVWDTEQMCLKGSPLLGHTGAVYCVDMSRGGKTIVSGSWDNTVRLWDAEGMQQKGEPLEGHTDYISCVALSDDERMVVSGSWDGSLRVWDTRLMCQVGWPLEGHTAVVRSVVISQDGKKIVSGSEDGTVRVWDAKRAWRQGSVLEGSSGGVRFVASLENGVGGVAGPPERALRRPGALQTSEDNRVPYSTDLVRSALISKDGAKIIFLLLNGGVRVWDVLQKCDISGDFQDFSERVSCLDVPDDGKWVATGSEEGTVSLWNLERWSRLVRHRKIHNNVVRSLAISAEGKHIVSLDWGEILYVWNTCLMGQLRGPLKCPYSEPHHLRISDDGTTVVSWSPKEETIWAWDMVRMCPLDKVIKLEHVVADLRLLENDLVLCLAWRKNALLRIDRAIGLIRLDHPNYRNGDISMNDIEIPVLNCLLNEIWMEFPHRRLLGTLEDEVIALTFNEASNSLLTLQRNGRVTKFRLVL